MLYPFLCGNWHVTHNVWHIWVFPVLKSPNNSVIESLSIPPPNNLSNSDEPVVKYTKFFLFSKYMLLGVKLFWHIFEYASIIFSTFISERPFIILHFFCWVCNYFYTVENCFTKFRYLMHLFRGLGGGLLDGRFTFFIYNILIKKRISIIIYNCFPTIIPDNSLLKYSVLISSLITLSPK